MSQIVQHSPSSHPAEPNILFTDAAARKVFELITEEGNPLLKLRVFITGGGCSGFQYGFSFEEAANEEDWQIHKAVQAAKANSDEEEEEGGEGGEGGQMVTLLIDPVSFQYLEGAEIDYREDINGAQFVIRNPNAKTTCGCGSSFAA